MEELSRRACVRPARGVTRATGGAQSAKVRRVDGIVKSVEPNGFVVSGKEHKKEREWAFAITDKTTMKRGDKELKAGDAVTVEYVEQDGKVIAQSVTVKDSRTSRPAEASGATRK